MSDSLQHRMIEIEDLNTRSSSLQSQVEFLRSQISNSKVSKGASEAQLQEEYERGRASCSSEWESRLKQAIGEKETLLGKSFEEGRLVGLEESRALLEEQKTQIAVLESKIDSGARTALLKAFEHASEILSEVEEQIVFSRSEVLKIVKMSMRRVLQ